jgi:hypothetical protein
MNSNSSSPAWQNQSSELGDAEFDWVINRVQFDDQPGRAETLPYLVLQRDYRGT